MTSLIYLRPRPRERFSRVHKFRTSILYLYNIIMRTFHICLQIHVLKYKRHFDFIFMVFGELGRFKCLRSTYHL